MARETVRLKNGTTLAVSPQERDRAGSVWMVGFRPQDIVACDADASNAMASHVTDAICLGS